MHNSIKFIALAVMTLSFGLSHAQKSDEHRELKELLEKPSPSDHEIDDAWTRLSTLVDVEVKLTCPMKDLLELILLYSKHDHSDAAYGFAYALKEFDPKEFEKALKGFSKEDAAKLKFFIETSEYVEKNGNG